MLLRILTSVIAVAIFLPILFLSETYVFIAAIVLISILCIFELLRCMKLQKNFALSVPLYIFSVAVPFLLRFLKGYMSSFTKIAVLFGVIYLMYLFVLVITSHGKLTFNAAMSAYIAVLYIIISLNSIIYVRDHAEHGQYIYLLVFLGAWVTDTFAYFTGYLFGKHKLIEDVSPKKTVEGSIGGIIFCAISFVTFGQIINQYFGTNANIIFLLVSGVFISVIAQIGDLIMSVVKRQNNIKDYGKFFPGHGGMIDRFDSVLATSAGVAVICLIASLFGISIL